MYACPPQNFTVNGGTISMDMRWGVASRSAGAASARARASRSPVHFSRTSAVLAHASCTNASSSGSTSTITPPHATETVDER
jgi:hypothetical protein